jgi:23S rRNA (uracil1939-C5)-methyltransferase
MTLQRQAHSFFQGNRYLLAPLVASVVERVADGPVLDLYAGVGLFAVALTTLAHDVIAVEGDRASAQDLKVNAAGWGGRLEAHHQSVEVFLATRRQPQRATVIVDPPRTGMTKDALRGALGMAPRRVLYVSCDVATLARDARIIIDSGYRLSHLQAFDLFPNTAHVETLAVFDSAHN